MESLNYIRSYNLDKVKDSLEVLDFNHGFAVSRDHYQIKTDSFAMEEVVDIYPLIRQQVTDGWARSYYSPEEHMESILAYGSKDVPAAGFNRPVWNQAIESVRVELRKLGIVQAYDVLSQLDLIPFESTSSAGYGYNGRKGPLLGPNHKKAIRITRAMIGEVMDRTDGIDGQVRGITPDIGYTRTQLTYVPDKLKVRGVWGRAFHLILLEGTSAAPLMDAFKASDTFFYVGKDPIQGVPEMINRAQTLGHWIYTLDWSAFDSSASSFEITTAFDLVKECMRFPNADTEAAFELSRQLFIHKKIAAPDGTIYWSHKGIPSGSYFTMMIGSIINRLRCDYIWRLLYGRSPNFIVTQGDDSLGSDDEQLDTYAASDIAGRHGWTLNPNKTAVTTDIQFIEFLGRTSKGGINARELVRCLRLVLLPELEVPNGQISAYRARAIADDAGGLSRILNTLADKLERKYGFIELEQVPKEFKLYKP